ncbi:MAG: NAD(P)/FAD-dependent oxidoreductase [Spirochaetales bacterium]|nr:NAD(P)/FAD-dependent oxidoreductase [Spirochaetales bacterium]
MKSDTFQLIVIGAGVGGCSIAFEAAKNGLSVVLIDKRKKEKIGEKFTCDTIPSYVFDELSLPLPEDDEIRLIVKMLKVFSPDMHSHFTADIGAYLVDRQKFSQRLLHYTLTQGVCLYDEAEYGEPVIENGFIIGVHCRMPGGEEKEFRGKIICDASGFPAVVRNSLPDSVYRNEVLNSHDVFCGYGEVRDIFIPSGTMEGIVPYKDFPGLYYFIRNSGYARIIPERDGRVNIGCWVPLNSRNFNPEKLTKQYGDSLSAYIGKKIYASSTESEAYIALRTCQPELIGNGFMVVGDAACQVSPISAFGIPGSMIGGKLAAEAAASAIRKGDVSREGLWKYNIRYKTGRGAAQAFIHLIHVFLQNIKDQDINILIKTGLLGATEFNLLMMNQTYTYTRLDFIKKFLSGFPHIRLLFRLRFLYSMCKKMEKHYRKFPHDIKKFDAWGLKRKRLYQKLFKGLKLEREI